MQEQLVLNFLDKMRRLCNPGDAESISTIIDYTQLNKCSINLANRATSSAYTTAMVIQRQKSPIVAI